MGVEQESQASSAPSAVISPRAATWAAFGSRKADIIFRDDDAASSAGSKAKVEVEVEAAAAAAAAAAADNDSSEIGSNSSAAHSVTSSDSEEGERGSGSGLAQQPDGDLLLPAFMDGKASSFHEQHVSRQSFGSVR